jgi:hypothetical protein
LSRVTHPLHARGQTGEFTFALPRVWKRSSSLRKTSRETLSASQLKLNIVTADNASNDTDRYD